MDIVVLYPGKFQPMAIYHREEYERICRKFDKDNVIIVTNDITDPIEKPLTYDEKFAIMRRHNVKHIQKSNTPFHATDVIEQFDGDATVVIYAVDKGILSSTFFSLPDFSVTHSGCPIIERKITLIKGVEKNGILNPTATLSGSVYVATPADVNLDETYIFTY